MYQLYNYFRSSASFRVRIALNLKEVPYELIPVHLLNNGGEQHSESYRKLNPQKLVPTLKILNNNSIITQSMSIIEYLNDAHPTPPFLPKDALQKAKIRSFALTIAADIHPLNNLRVLQYLTNELQLSEDQKKSWYQHWISLGFDALEKQIEANTTTFCFGDSPTLADIFLVPQIYNARRYECDLTPYPTLVRIDKNCQDIKAFSDAFPEETQTV